MSDSRTENYTVGDKVYIHEGSKYWSYNTVGNPRDQIGVVFFRKPNGSVRVRWQNGCTNSYYSGELTVLGNTGMSKEEAMVWHERSV